MVEFFGFGLLGVVVVGDLYVGEVDLGVGVIYCG